MSGPADQDTRTAGLDDDEEFHRLGRAAGAELRLPPPARGAAAARSTARRHRAVGAGAAVVVVLGVTVGAVALLIGDPGTDDPTPVTVPVTLPATAPAPIAFDAGAGDIDDRRTLVMIASADGSVVSTVADDVDGLDQFDVEWSPDGERLAFAMVARDGTTDLWVVDADGTDAERLVDCDAPCRWIEWPAWSPDGRTIAVSKLSGVFGDAAVGTLELVDVDDGTSEVLLTADPQDFFVGASWSPDGRELVVAIAHRPDTTPFSQPEAAHLAIVDVTSSPPTLRDLTDPTGAAWSPDWSPDGTTIVFEGVPAPGTDQSELFVIQPDGAGRRRLTNLTTGGGGAYAPSFSNDGTRILFAAGLTPGEHAVLASVAVDGSDLRPALGDTFVAGDGPKMRPTP